VCPIHDILLIFTIERLKVKTCFAFFCLASMSVPKNDGMVFWHRMTPWLQNFQELNLDYDGKRDRWNGFQPDDYKQVIEDVLGWRKLLLGRYWCGWVEPYNVGKNAVFSLKILWRSKVVDIFRRKRIFLLTCTKKFQV